MNDRQRCQDNEHLQRFTPANEMAPGCAGAISEKALMRITYSGIYDEPIRLTEGLYQVIGITYLGRLALRYSDSNGEPGRLSFRKETVEGR